MVLPLPGLDHTVDVTPTPSLVTEHQLAVSSRTPAGAAITIRLTYTPASRLLYLSGGHWSVGGHRPQP